MTKYVALLRAINVGGTGKLPMADLKAMCEEAGFAHVATYIASGNVVFESKASEAKVKAALEERLHAYAGKPIGVVVRTAAEMAAVVKANPFPKASPSQAVAIFLDKPPPADALEARGRRQRREDAARQARDLRSLRPAASARSKLRIPAAKTGTMRNMNTIAKLAELAAKIGTKK